ncbi:metallophosphoesterase family protein [Haladaptatus sp. NG-SE-30]
MENTYADIRKKQHLDITVKVVTCRPGSGSRRAFEMTVEDVDGTSFSFTVWAKSSNGRDYPWQEGHWYRLHSAYGEVWPAGRELHGTGKLEIEHKGVRPTDRRAKLLYLTDTHLGKQTGGHKNNSWKIDTVAGFNAAIDLAIEHRVDAVVHTGDVFHNDTRNGIPSSIEEACHDGLTELANAEIPFYFIYGNHARKKGRVCLEQFCDAGLATHLRSRPAVIGDAVALYGVDYQKSWDHGQLGFERPPSGVATLLCMHQSVAPLTGSPNPDCHLQEVLEESTISIDGLALGHLHTNAEKTLNGCSAFCGGATERLTSDLEPSVETITVEQGEIRRQRHVL